MRRLPIDVNALRFLCAIAPQEVLDEYRRPKADRTTGEALFSTQLVVLSESEGAEVIKVTTAGCPKVQQGSMVKVRNLVASPWLIEGRAGVAFRAEAREPDSAAAAAAPAAKAS
jgi:hypothetical protein